jgi:hypothetical protein
VPLEILHEIIHSYVVSAQALVVAPYLGDTLQLPFSAVRSLSLASKASRDVTLEAWFRVCTIRRPQHPEGEGYLWRMSCGARWAIKLQVVSGETTNFFVQLLLELGRRWTKLRAVRIDFRFFDGFDTFSVLLGVRVVDVYIEGPTPMLVAGIAQVFPNIHDLHIHATRTWCGLCYLPMVLLCKATDIDKITYKDGLGLPVSTNFPAQCV